MLSIQPPSSPPSKDQCTPNLLPCRIHHNGPANASQRYWNPTVGADGQPEAYFRGRKLKGKRLPVPEGYRGVVIREKEGGDLEKGKNEGGKSRIGDEEEEEDGENVQTVGTLEEAAEFEEVIVWNHEAIPSGDDAFVKGMEEWIRFAEVIHDTGEAETDGDKGEGSEKVNDSRT